MNYSQDKIYWVKDRNFKVTSLVVWDDNYLPYSVILFRKDSPNNYEIRTYVTIEGIVYKEDFIINENRTETEGEVLYKITNWVQKLINIYVIFDKDEERLLHINDASMACRNEMFLVNIFSLKKTELDKLQTEAPKFGFYSMAPNFDEYVSEMETNENSVLTINFNILADRHNK